MAEVKKVKLSKVQIREKSVNQSAGKKVAAILIRGTIGLRKDMKDTLTMLNINTKYRCAVLENTPVSNGMLFKLKDQITYGEISEETLKELDAKRPKGDKKSYALHPPRGGFEKKGTKKSFKDGGALGYRGDKMNDLIKRML
jgi:large subunit ribosomal protein L30